MTLPGGALVQTALVQGGEGGGRRPPEGGGQRGARFKREKYRTKQDKNMSKKIYLIGTNILGGINTKCVRKN